MYFKRRCIGDDTRSLRLLKYKLPEPFIVPHRMILSWYTGRWWVGRYIWYSEKGTGRGHSPPRPLLAVPNVPNITAHPSTASVPIVVLLYDGPLLCGCDVAIKGLRKEEIRYVERGYLPHCRNSETNCFFAQNFTEIGQSAADLWPKNDFQYSGRPPSSISKYSYLVTWRHRVPDLLSCNEFHQSRVIFRWNMTI